VGMSVLHRATSSFPPPNPFPAALLTVLPPNLRSSLITPPYRLHPPFPHLVSAPIYLLIKFSLPLVRRMRGREVLREVWTELAGADTGRRTRCRRTRIGRTSTGLKPVEGHPFLKLRGL
jgi:hypothetical protein